MVPALRKACPACGERYPAPDLRCPACGVSWRTATQARQKERETDALADTAGFGPEREVFKMGVVGGVILLLLAGVWAGINALCGWGQMSPAVTAVCGVISVLWGLATGNFDGSRKRGPR